MSIDCKGTIALMSNADTKITMSLKLIINITFSYFETGIETCLELIIPTLQDTTVFLRLTINFEKHPDYVVNVMKMMEIEQNSLITFVETDKPIYKPGQDVNIRILMLKHDLKPWKKPVRNSFSLNYFYRFCTKLIVHRFQKYGLKIRRKWGWHNGQTWARRTGWYSWHFLCLRNHAG